MVIVRNWVRRGRWLKRDTYALFLACRDPRTPLAARILGVAVVAYAFSPIDLIPDFIPILGALDDLILVPVGLSLVLRMIPPEVMEDARSRADVVVRRGSRVVTVVVVLIWVALAALALYMGARAFNLI